MPLSAYGRTPNSAVREASRAGGCPAGCSVTRRRLSGRVQRLEERHQCIEPQKKVVRPWRGLDDRGIRLPARSERSEIRGTCGDAEQDKTREKQVLRHC